MRDGDRELHRSLFCYANKDRLYLGNKGATLKNVEKQRHLFRYAFYRNSVELRNKDGVWVSGVSS